MNVNKKWSALSKKIHKEKPENLCPILTTEILWRYHEYGVFIIENNIPHKKNTTPKKLDEQISLKIDTIIELTPELIEEMEKQLKIIRDDNDELEKTIQAQREAEARKEEERKKKEEEIKKEEERKKKIFRDYIMYNQYIQTHQYASAIKHFKNNSKSIIAGYNLYMDNETLWDYISKLATTVCTKNNLKKLPKYYSDHLFIETLPLILVSRLDIVKTSQNHIAHIAQFFPLWEQLLIAEEELIEI